MTRVALYARVSTNGQTVENQLGELQAVAKRHGWKVVATYTDNAVSGSKGRNERPGFANLHKAVAQRQVDLVAAWSVDRLGRSLQHLVAFLGELHAKGVDLYLHQQGIDTTTPAGRAMFQMMGVFAEFERAMIQERVKTGLARAKSDGTRLGRPPLSLEQRAEVLKLRSEGRTIRQIAAETGVSRGSVHNIVG